MSPEPDGQGSPNAPGNGRGDGGTPAPEPAVREAVARPASLVASATMCSRLTGLAREAIFAALFATSWFADAFVLAFRIPNLLRDFFAEGALASAFVPTFTEVKTKEGDARAFLLARRVMGTLGLVTAVIALLGILFAPAIVLVIAPDAPADVQPIVVRLARIMFPFLMLVAMASVAMGVLNTHGRYFLPALAPMFFNVSAVLGGGVLLLLGLPDDTAVTVWAALVLLGGVLQLVVQLPLTRRVGLRGRPLVDLRLTDPALRHIVRKMGPVILSVAATNVMLLITTALASRGEGWASSLNFAFRLVHLPIGLIGVALGTVVLAAGSRRHAAKDHAGLDDLGRRALRINWYLALPAAVGLFVMAEPLVALLFERGAFDAQSTADVASALRYYAGGVVFYAGIKAAAPLFLSRGDTRSPMLCSILGIVVNVIVALALIEPLGHRGLALAVACGAATNYTLLRFAAWRAYGTSSFTGFSHLARVGLSSAIMGGVGWLATQAWLVRDGAVASSALRGGLTIAVCFGLLALYLATTALLGLEEGQMVRARFSRRRRTRD